MATRKKSDRPIELRWPELMDKETAASYLSMSLSTIDRLIANGELPVRVIGTMTRIQRYAIDEWIDRQPGYMPKNKRKAVGVIAFDNNKSRRQSAVS